MQARTGTAPPGRSAVRRGCDAIQRTRDRVERCREDRAAHSVAEIKKAYVEKATSWLGSKRGCGIAHGADAALRADTAITRCGDSWREFRSAIAWFAGNSV